MKRISFLIIVSILVSCDKNSKPCTQRRESLELFARSLRSNDRDLLCRVATQTTVMVVDYVARHNDFPRAVSMIDHLKSCRNVSIINDSLSSDGQHAWVRCRVEDYESEVIIPMTLVDSLWLVDMMIEDF